MVLCNPRALIFVKQCLCTQDGVAQPWEDDGLAYTDFSLRLPLARIRHLPALLKSITPDDERRLREGLAAAWPAFVWGRGAGGRAYERLVDALRRRAVARAGGLLI